MKKAFTLAEIIVVLVIIGILTAILIPIFSNDVSEKEKVLKFLKGNDNLESAIGELLSSEKYFLNGDLGKKPNGELIDGSHSDDKTYFCDKLAEILGHKTKNCITENTGINGYISSSDSTTLAAQKKWLDTECMLVQKYVKRTSKKEGKEIKTVDDIYYFQTAPDMLFGMDKRSQLDYYCSTSVDAVDKNAADYCKNGAGVGSRAFGATLNSGGFDVMYKTICFDIDGVPDGADKDNCINECPFAYGIRADGKIVSGARADEWLQKSNENE